MTKTFRRIIVVFEYYQDIANWNFQQSVSVIPQTCKYRGAKFECGLSISCVLGGGRPVDLCSGGLIWSCCVDDDDIPDTVTRPTVSLLQNASKFARSKTIARARIFKLETIFIARRYERKIKNYNEGIICVCFFFVRFESHIHT